MKSHASDQLELLTCIYNDAVSKCADVPLDRRDLITIKSRLEHEGLSFLTITLPNFGKEFDLALDQGWIDSTHFRAFRKRGRIPAFLQGFLSRVFDEAGRIRDEPCVEIIEGVRQIAYTFKKLKVECTPKRVSLALTQFRSSERDLHVPIVPSDLEDFLQVSHAIWSIVFGSEINFLSDLRPKHGPGATAEKLSGNAKFLMQRWHDRLEPYFPLLDTAFVNSNAMDSEEFEKMTIILEPDEQPVRVVTVPKTLKGPRVIAIEPVCMQYTQQALAEYLTSVLESHPLTKGHINFRDQSINGRLALTSSMSRKYATIDLSSASDRVPYSVAIRMFDSNPDLQGAISACRSKRAQMPDGSVLDLLKFAPMGSALCFPVESMYFYTICVAALLWKRNLPVTYLNIKKVSRQVYVYGDDIIVPTNESVDVTKALQKYYCKVNLRKSFSRGNFRESCGVDAFNGEVVTPTYVREVHPSDMRSANAIVSWIATSNLFYLRGYWRTSDYMRKHVETITGSLPVTGANCAGLGWRSFQPYVSSKRWNRRFHCPEVRTLVASPVYRRDELDGYPALLKSILRLERSSADDYSIQEEHLKKTARRGAVTLKRRWVRPY